MTICVDNYAPTDKRNTLNTRLIAARVLVRVLQDGQSLTAALDANLPAVELSKDKAFVQALCYGVCRHYYRLDFMLNELLAKPIKDLDVKALALVGLYQLSYMRVKPHAAVSETVLATRKKPWAKALINALLRNYQRDQASLEQKADTVNWVSLSHPLWLVQKIQQDWPEQAQAILLENNQQPPMSLRVNLSRISTEHYLQQLTAQAISAVAVDGCPSAIILEKPVAVDLLPGFMDGLVSVQDVAAQLAANLLDVQPGQRVLDVCAAPGGKAAHILEQQPQLKELIAVDIDSTRLLRVNETLQRLKLSATLIAGDGLAPQDWWDGQVFERILLDAPCSALGVIRRHPDIKLLRRADDIEALQALQQNILKAIWPLLAPGGLMVYATCSILKQENEQQIATFLASHADAREVPIEEAVWGITTDHGRQIITGTSAMDGFYYARLTKVV
jgi:16S rRNA (cytosine967-C5)-methyltransferase